MYQIRLMIDWNLEVKFLYYNVSLLLCYSCIYGTLCVCVASSVCMRVYVLSYLRLIAADFTRCSCETWIMMSTVDGKIADA